MSSGNGKRWALGGGLLASGAAAFQAMSPTAQRFGATIHRERAAGRLIALTYDDGPNPTSTPALLELLARHDARATFFLIGRWAAREPELVRATAAAGHALGNHTHTHPTMPAHGAARIREELARCRAAVEGSGADLAEIDGLALMRPPYGHRRPGTLRTARAEGYVPVLWSVTSFDWRRRTTAERIARRCARARGGDVVLLHDGSDAEPARDCSATVAATAALLERYTARGYRFVTVPELVAAAQNGQRTGTSPTATAKNSASIGSPSFQ